MIGAAPPFMTADSSVAVSSSFWESFVWVPFNWVVSAKQKEPATRARTSNYFDILHHSVCDVFDSCHRMPVILGMTTLNVNEKQSIAERLDPSKVAVTALRAACTKHMLFSARIERAGFIERDLCKLKITRRTVKSFSYIFKIITVRGTTMIY